MPGRQHGPVLRPQAPCQCMVSLGPFNCSSSTAAACAPAAARTIGRAPLPSRVLLAPSRLADTSTAVHGVQHHNALRSDSRGAACSTAATRRRCRRRCLQPQRCGGGTANEACTAAPHRGGQQQQRWGQQQQQQQRCRCTRQCPTGPAGVQRAPGRRARRGAGAARAAICRRVRGRGAGGRAGGGGGAAGGAGCAGVPAGRAGHPLPR